MDYKEEIGEQIEKLEPVFVPYDLPLENIETKGNYQKTDFFGTPCYNISPYGLTVDKDKVSEMNLEAPDKDKLYYTKFKHEQ